MLAWTPLLITSVAIHIADSVEVPRATQQSITEGLRSAIESVTDETAVVDTDQGCSVPEDCAAAVLTRTEAKELLLVYMYAGIARTQVIVRRTRGHGFLSSEEVFISSDEIDPPDWRGVVARSFWDLAGESPVSSRPSLAGPVTLLALGGATLITSAGFGIWTGQLESSGSGLVDDELEAHLATYDTARTTSFALLGTGVALIVAGGLWAFLQDR